MRWVKIAVLILLLAWYGVFLFHKIDLTTSDLGRHIKNGEEILTGNFQVLYTNYYSYTNPDYPFVNHHWLFGVVFYWLWKTVGFSGLQLFFIILSLVTFWFFFDLARKNTGWKIAIPAALFLIPLIAERTEVRPEAFSYFFAGIFLWILWRRKWPWTLPFLMLLWVNLHVYFFVGILILFIFLLNNFKLWRVFLASSLAIPINPFGYRAILFPVYALQNYGYKIVENQSVWFLQKLGVAENPNYAWFWLALAALIAAGVFAFFKKEKNSLVFFLPAVVFGLMAAFAVRNFTIFALFTLPAVSCGIKTLFNQSAPREEKYAISITALILILIITFFSHQTKMPFLRGDFGLGLMPGNESAAKFLKEAKIAGPIFNNYDIGSYLSFYLEPKSVFVDNRPEAYPVSFFEKIYIPMQESEKKWKEANETYNFKTIVFAWHDYTPWGQKFLSEKLKDPAWKRIYLDNYVIIFEKSKP